MHNQAALASLEARTQAHELSRHHLNPSLTGNEETPVIDHWVLQLRGVHPERMNDPEKLRAVLCQMVDSLQLTRVSDHTHYFGPGVSSVIILAESHLSVHTWPELGYLHADIVTCVKKLTRRALEAAFRKAFAPAQVRIAQLEY